jgi:hypothetical protein
MMSTTAPVSPAPLPAPTAPVAAKPAAPATTPTWVQSWETLIKAHEKLIIVAILALTAFHLYSRGIDYLDRRDSKTAQAAAVVVKTDDTKSKADAATLAALTKTVAQQQMLIAQQIVKQKQQTQAQQQNDATLPLPDLGARLALIAQLTPADVNSTQVPGSLVVSAPGALKVTQELETIPELQAENTALNTELTNDNTIIAKQTTLIGDLNVELADEKKSHVADVAAQKVKTRHAFLRGLKIGLGVGFIAGLVTGHYAHTSY